MGLHNAKFEHVVLVENDPHAVLTLRHNIENLGLDWGEIYAGDLKVFAREEAAKYEGLVDLVAGGVPCPPFSKAGKKLGRMDERDLFPAALEVVGKVKPTALMLENVAGLLEAGFKTYRNDILSQLESMGYEGKWELVQASDFGVSQLRPRAILVAVRKPYFRYFEWPEPNSAPPPTVGEVLYPIMKSMGWRGAKKWRNLANEIAPTIVGGSKKHGGPDLGPTRAKNDWKKLHVNAHRVGDEEELPGRNFRGALLRDGTVRSGFENMPLLTVPMAALLQGFPHEWEFIGAKTHAYRQVGNAFPPPVARAIGDKIRAAIRKINRRPDTAVRDRGRAA